MWRPQQGGIHFIEAIKMPVRKNLIFTGQLGEVMQGSAQAALRYLRTQRFRRDAKSIAKSDIHLHVPEGAPPKDGLPSGMAITVALVSLFTGNQVRGDMAMIGEITQRGRVLPAFATSCWARNGPVSGRLFSHAGTRSTRDPRFDSQPDVI